MIHFNTELLVYTKCYCNFILLWTHLAIWLFAENSISSISISITSLIKYISWAFGSIPKYGSRLLRLRNGSKLWHRLDPVLFVNQPSNLFKFYIIVHTDFRLQFERVVSCSVTVSHRTFFMP